MRCDSEAHKMHMCTLKAEGKSDLIESLSNHPTVECKQCGAKANSLQYICAAHLGDQAPNVEGGHGFVDFDDVGKAHAGRKADPEE